MERTKRYRALKVETVAREMVWVTNQVRKLEAQRKVLKEQLVALMQKDENIRVGTLSVCKAWRDDYTVPEHHVEGNWVISVRKVSKKLAGKVK